MNWLAYFEENRRGRPNVPWEPPVQLDREMRRALLRSLQRFEVGERGDGKHLLRAAASLSDPRYLRCLQLFIAEEQVHAHLLAQAIHALGGKCLRWHWTDAAFVGFRHLAGLRVELLVLLTAEIIGLAYYRELRDTVTDPVLHAMFCRMVRDEEAHIAFHCDSLRQLLVALPPWGRLLVHGSWYVCSRCVMYVAWLNHRPALLRASAGRSTFLRTCVVLIVGASVRIFARHPQPAGATHGDETESPANPHGERSSRETSSTRVPTGLVSGTRSASANSRTLEDGAA